MIKESSSVLDILISENSFSCNFTYIKCVTYLARKDNTNFPKYVASGNGDLETFLCITNRKYKRPQIFESRASV